MNKYLLAVAVAAVLIGNAVGIGGAPMPPIPNVAATVGIGGAPMPPIPNRN